VQIARLLSFEPIAQEVSGDREYYSNLIKLLALPGFAAELAVYAPRLQHYLRLRMPEFAQDLP
jgi:hypothetical protein